MTVNYIAVGATIFAVAVIIGWIISWIIHITSMCFGFWHLYKKLEAPAPGEELPGVSIIKPLTGVDTNLKSNLETFFTQSYPHFELLFSVPDDNDPAILVVKSLIDCYPKVDAKLFIGLKNVGPNGKINNMIRPYEAAKYDNIIISDNGIKMTPTTLYELVHCLKPDVGLVLQMPYCATRKGFGAIYQQVYFGTMQARNCLSANAVNINCSTGMSSLLRRDVLDSAGGLKEFGKYLAEDYFIAEGIKSKGYKVVLATTPTLQNSGNCSIEDFHKRMIRWAQLRVSMVPTLIILEPFGESILLGTVTSWAVSFLFDISPLAFFLGHLLVWFLFDYTLFRIVEATQSGRCEHVYCASGGNAGLAAAHASRQLNIPCTIILPSTTPDFVADQLRGLGAEVRVHGDVYDESKKLAQELGNEPGSLYVPAFEHPDIWEGHSSIIAEAEQQMKVRPDIVVTSVGGGGLLNGIIQGMREVGWTNVPVLALETHGANCFNAAVTAGKVVTLPAITSVAKCLGALTVNPVSLENYTRGQPRIVSRLVTDKQAVHACLEFAKDHRFLVEPACGASLAAIYSHVINHLVEQGELQKIKTALVVVCGGAMVSTSVLEGWKDEFGL